MLERLRPAARAVGGVRARDALGSAGRPRRVEEERRLALVTVERAGVLGPVGQLIAVAHDDARPTVAEAVVELLVGETPGERHGDRPDPLAGPVEERCLESVVEDERHAVARLDAETAPQAPHAREQLTVRHAGERLQLGVALAGRQQRVREVHDAGVRACVAATQASIASTIGA